MRTCSFKKFLLASALGIACTAVATPASAQISVFDPTNYSQNLLSAARALEQINNQIQSLQNEAAMLQNMAKNLKPTDFPQLQALTERLKQIDQLMARAQAVDFRVDSIDDQLRKLFPQGFDQALTSNAQVQAAKARLDAQMAAYQQTMRVQAQVVENVRADVETLNAITARSQGAEGALQVGQATNQLLALLAKQQLQIQNLMAAQYRAEAIEAARRAKAEADARAATKKFLGSGSAYTSQPPGN
ncbi:P-type conjugative transfer protein TrbJ [Sphingomonas canadensis]|uniref:P-type conjugative transfer protein TrbJ n=1 Tax=Sphingomonas canadensis TaxID=1219257 RepID=A0ABW3H2E9_9SPHN|nr:P-type conjugative transfer protein TrbJ [Sphingomonas canadensis]MCW3835057.1 P-type conjugative transfer protein TrbJ [Sphingomonas canadensis]